MSEEEQNELFKKAFANTLRKLAEEPEELFDNDKLQKKYNNLLKEHIKLKQELQQKENIIKEVREYIEKHTYHDTPKKLQNGIYERGELIIKNDFYIEDLVDILRGVGKE